MATVTRLFQGVTDAEYGQLWAACRTNLTLADEVREAEALPTLAEKVRAVYEHVIQRAARTGAPLPAIALATFHPDRLAELSQAETLYKFFCAIFHQPAWDPQKELMEFFETLQGDLIVRAAAIATWMEEHRATLASFKSLHVFEQDLTYIPPQIGLFTSLEVFNLSDNQIRSLPSEIGRCVALKRLTLFSNRLTAIPSQIGECSRLIHLSLDNNRLTALPEEIGNCIHLKDLSLKHNRLSTLPGAIGRCIRLEILNISENELTSVPAEIGQCVALRYLDLSGNQLAALPQELGECVGLKSLQLSRNRLTALPGELGQCHSLESLIVSDNLLTSIPREIALCGERRPYWHLMLDHNQLAELPQELWQCPRLTRLHLEHNQFTRIPDDIRLTGVINLSHNQIEQTREELFQLLPANFAAERLNLNGNPLRPPPGFWESLWIRMTHAAAWAFSEVCRLWQSLVVRLRGLIRA
jgi:Leucine-rich repeat (LRR) protein